MSTIYPEVCARHKAAGITEQEDGGTSVVFGPAKRIEHVVLRPLDFALGELVEELLHHLRHDVAR